MLKLIIATQGSMPKARADAALWMARCREPGPGTVAAGAMAAASARFRGAGRQFAAYRSGRTEFSSNASSGSASAEDVVAGCVSVGRVLAAAHTWRPDEVAGVGL